MRPSALAMLAGTAAASFAAAAAADTVVTSKRTTAIATSRDGNLTVKKDGTVEVTSEDPVVVDRAGSVTLDEGGAITAGARNGAAGVKVTTRDRFDLSNKGSISVEENFTPLDEDNNGVVDGPVARATERAGVRLVGATQGTINNEGSIRVEGLRSFGIVAEGPFSGTLTNTGLVQVIGDRSTAIRLRDVAGSVSLDGSVTAIGEGAQALVIDGDLTGSLKIQGSVGTSQSFTNDKDSQSRLSRANLRVRAPAVEIKGDVTGGILLAAAPYDLSESDKDEDKDGVEDSKETTGSLRSQGVSPALMIGGDEALTIGAAKGRDGSFSLVVDGSINADAVYSNLSSVAVEIGGRGQTTLGSGIGVSGSITAQTNDSSATALLLNETAVVPTLTNSGSISASISVSGDGSAIAVQDRSGTLRSVVNTGTIRAGGTRDDEQVALDLSRAGGAVEIRQSLNDIDREAKRKESEKDGYNPDNPTIYAAIYGDMRLSAFNDLVSASTGLIESRIFFGSGDDRLALSDDAAFRGEVRGGAGRLEVSLANKAKFQGLIDAEGQAGLLSLADQSVFRGYFANAERFTASVGGGTLFADSGKVARLGRLEVGAGGSIGVVIDGEEGTSSSFEVGSASFASGAKVRAQITSIGKAEGEYVILTAGQISGTPTFDPATSDVPLLFNGTLRSTASTLTLSLKRKSSAELGFGAAEDAAYSAILEQFGEAPVLEQSILQAGSIANLRQQFGDLLPDYRGGLFEAAVRSTGLVTRRFDAQTQDFSETADNGMWLQPIVLRAELKGTNEAEKSTIASQGAAGGFEWWSGLGTLGVDFSYLSGRVKNGDRQTIKTGLLAVGLNWRRRFGAGYGFARLSVGNLSAASTRLFRGEVDGAELEWSAKGDWNGLVGSASVGGSVDLTLGDRLTFRPKGVVDFHVLREGAYVEDGERDDMLLSVARRTSSRTSLLATMTSSLRLGPRVGDGTPLTLDLEGGRRFLLTEKLGSTRARFDGGDPFLLAAASGHDAWVGEAKLRWGGTDFSWDIAAGGERSRSDWAAHGRAALTLAF